MSIGVQIRTKTILAFYERVAKRSHVHTQRCCHVHYKSAEEKDHRRFNRALITNII